MGLSKNFEIRVYVVENFISKGKRIEILALPSFDVNTIPEVINKQWTLKEIKYVSGELFYFEDNGGQISTTLKSEGYYYYDASVKFGER